ncbi:MAG: ABC transporter ATP-binding protein [Burkholderiaceae bacterium]
MLEALRQLRSLCSDQDITRLWVLLGVVIATGFLEVAGIASVLPFLQLASDPLHALDNPWIRQGFELIGFGSTQQMMFWLGLAVVVLLTVSNVLAAVATWYRQVIAWTIAHEVSVQLARSYSRLPYAFFLNRDSADLIKSVIEDVNSLVNGVVVAGCQLLSQVIVAGMILALLAFVNPGVALTALAVFAGVYLLVFAARKRYLTDLGRERVQANSDRYTTFSDLMSGMKTVKSDGAAEFFIKRFEKPSKRFSETQPKIHLSTVMPRYIVETVAFGAIVGIVLVLSGQEDNFVTTMPTLTLFALAGYRLMPALNLAYVSLAQVTSSYPAIENIHRDLSAAPEPAAHTAPQVSFSHSIALNQLNFSYPNSDQAVLDDVSLTIQKGQKVAFVGPSGSGKTTLIDVVTGMLTPERGTLTVDNLAIDSGNVAGWQALIGYVPQEVFLYNETIEKNVAFGFDVIDSERVREVCRIAQIAETIQAEMPEAYQTRIGERGVRLSGGQRQRLGLARALYRSPSVLVLDEATSALDSHTEAKVIAAIYDQLPTMTTIMIAHRISTVRRCDKLFVMDRGRLVDEGSYQTLLDTDTMFKELARFD